jgi:hypothetical protein
MDDTKPPKAERNAVPIGSTGSGFTCDFNSERSFGDGATMPLDRRGRRLHGRRFRPRQDRAVAKAAMGDNSGLRRRHPGPGRDHVAFPLRQPAWIWRSALAPAGARSPV